MQFHEWLFLETIFNKTFYHGTPAVNVSEILANGLRVSKPQINADKALYLTSDIQLAAKYAVGAYNRIVPAILDINLSRAALSGLGFLLILHFHPSRLPFWLVLSL